MKCTRRPILKFTTHARRTIAHFQQRIFSLPTSLLLISFPPSSPYSAIMSEQTIPAKNMVQCGDPRDPHGPTGYFAFDCQAPASLCKDLPSTGPDEKYYDTFGAFISATVKQYEGHILRSCLWQCIVCKKPARALMSGAIPHLTPTHGKEPVLMDIMAPVCFPGGLYSDQSSRILSDYVKREVPETTTVKDDLRFCHRCGKMSGLKMCNGCNSCR